MYLEGYVEEGLVESRPGSADPTVTSEEVHRSGGSTITDRKHRATFSMIPGEMRAFGIPERTI